MMRRTAAALVFLVTLLAATGVAHARVVVGMGDQKPAMFTDKRLHWLGVRDARIVVSWNVMASKREREWAQNWLILARRSNVQPLVAFGHAWGGKARNHLPSLKAYTAAFTRFKRSFPWVRNYTAWNEANHCSQPTCHQPERAAAYYDAIRSGCPRCTVVAGDVLDQPNMVSWLKRFRRAARHKPELWGMHNYLDANRLRTTGTRRMLKAVKGRVWITETGGLVYRKHYRSQIAFPESEPHAAEVTRFLFKFADTQPRIRRIYLYQWNASSLLQTWDSGLIDSFNKPRPAFDELARYMRRDPRKVPRDAAPVDTGPPPPGPAGPGAEEPPQQQQTQQQQQQQSPPPPKDPPPPDCSPLPTCPPVGATGPTGPIGFLGGG